ncbi:DUF7558 family protein [Halobaculum roseum]|uniref:DUF7558 family protein n=1 Tax=Halobaculum roseum TaxID=2175149 RepID=UPI003CE54A68
MVAGRVGFDKFDNFVCDSYGLVVAALAALTGFRVEVRHLEGPSQVRSRCSPSGARMHLICDFNAYNVSG